MTLKLRARCENNHFVSAECWDFAGYYMLEKLPPKWHWEVAIIGPVDEAGFVVTSLDWENDAKLKQNGFDDHRGTALSQEEAVKLVKQRHAVICNKPLEPMTRWDCEYGWRDDG